MPDHGPLATEFSAMLDTMAALVTNHQPLTLHDLNHIVHDWGEEFLERLRSLEDFQRLRHMSGEVVRLKPAFALLQGGRYELPPRNRRMTMPDGMQTKKRSSLRAVAPKESRPTKAKILIFGKPSVGKTFAAIDFPAVYFIDVEGGAKEKRYIEKLEASGGVYFGPEHGATSFDEVLGQIKALATEDHTYKSVVIDSISKLFALEIAREAERLAETGKKNEFGADKRPAVGYMRQLVAWLMRLDMNAILIAHYKAEWGRDKNGERVEIGDSFDCWDKLEYELDLALNITKQGPSRIARVRKSRLGAFPDASNFPWSYEEFANRYGRDVIEGTVKSVVLATPEQVGEVKRLLGVVKVPDDWADKCFTKANVVSWDEMDTDTISKVIEALKERLVS